MVACADITSSNIVGYTNKDAGADFSLVIPMFQAVGSDSYDIQTIIPQGENAVGYGDVNMQTFTTDANADETFLWLTVADMGVEEDGWYNEDMSTKAEKIFAPGEGFMLCAGAGAISLNFAGEVNAAEVTVNVPADFSLLGNIRPTGVSIQTIIPQGENAVGYGDVNMQTFTADANADETFLWLTVADMGVEEDGWYNEDMSTLADKVFAPGEGFMLCAGAGACQLKFSAMGL